MSLISRIVSRIFATIFLLASVPAGIAFAGGTPSWTATLTPAQASSPANNTNIPVAIHAYEYLCTPTDPNNPIGYASSQQCLNNGYTGSTQVPADNVTVYVSGNGAGYLSPSQVLTDASGNATVVVRSPFAGSMIISAYYSPDATQPSHGSTTVSFTAVATPVPTAKPVAKTATPSPKTSPLPSTPTPTVVPVAVASPTIMPTPSPAAIASTHPTRVLSATTYGLVGLVVLALLLGLLLKLGIIKLPQPRNNVIK